jgi:hypothetical protein
MGAPCLLLTLAGGCGADDKDALSGVRTLRGRYASNFEDWHFTECGGSTPMAIDPFTFSTIKNFDLITQAESTVCAIPVGGTDPCANHTAYKTVYAQVVAEVSAPGKYGHLGKFTYEMTIAEVLAASAVIPGDCP